MHLSPQNELIIRREEPESNVLRSLALKSDNPDLRQAVDFAEEMALWLAATDDEDINDHIQSLEATTNDTFNPRWLWRSRLLDAYGIKVEYVLPERSLGALLLGAHGQASRIEFWQAELESAQVNGPDLVTMDMAAYFDSPDLLDVDHDETPGDRIQAAQSFLRDAEAAECIVKLLDKKLGSDN